MVSLREVSPDWASITTNDLITGLKYNTGFVSGGYEPIYFIGDKSITASYENNSIQNCTQVLCALLRDNADLTIKTLATTGEARYTIGKASDIKYVSRYIDSYLVSVSNTYTAVIPEDVSEMIGRYDSRFTSNALGGKLICRITSDSIEYLRAFTISSQTITLKDIVTGSNSGISTLTANDRFELINAYDILEEGLEETTGYPVQGYVKKHVKPSEDTSYVEFGVYDKPAKLSGDYVCISYNKLDDYNQTFIYDNSINKYGIFTKKEDLNISVTQDQINLIETTLQKLTEPKITIELETFRPTKPQKGWMINVDVQNMATGVFEVINVSESYIYPDGQLIDKPFRLWKVTLSNYKNNLASVLAGLKRKNTMSQAKLADNQILRTFINLNLRYRFIDDPSEFTLDAPIALDASPINTDDFTAKWQSVANADDYIIFAALDNAFTIPITGFAGLLVGNVLSRVVDGQDVTDNDTFYYKVKAVNLALGLESDWSNTIEVNKITHLSFPSSITGSWGTLSLSYGFIFNPASSGDFTDYSQYNRSVAFFGSGTNPTWIEHNNQWGLDFSSSNNKGLSFVADSNLISNTENTFIIEFANLTDPSVPQGLFTVWISGGIAISTGGGSDTSKIFVNTTNDFGSNHQVKTNNSQIGTAIISYSIKCQSGAEDYLLVRNQITQSLTGTAITDISSFRNINGIRAIIGNFYSDGNFMSNAQFRGVIKRFAIIKQKLTDAQIKEIHRLMGYT